VTLVAASESDRSIIANLLELYLDEYSTVDGRRIGDDGRYGYDGLNEYWTDPGRSPFLILVDGHLGGFALVMERALLEPNERGHLVAEFFVLRRYRRQGVGQAASHQLFAHFPGEWLVPEHAGNATGIAFWRRVIDRYTDGVFEEKAEVWAAQNVIVQTFQSPVAPGA
jgi:predicted acetyltransferase